jgi:hypothetical protein
MSKRLLSEKQCMYIMKDSKQEPWNGKRCDVYLSLFLLKKIVMDEDDYFPLELVLFIFSLVFDNTIILILICRSISHVILAINILNIIYQILVSKYAIYV